MLQGVERNGTIHCAGVDEDVAEACCDSLGEGALAARRVAVDGNDYLVCVTHMSLKVDDYGDEGIYSQGRNYNACNAVNHDEVSWPEVAAEEVDKRGEAHPPYHSAE